MKDENGRARQTRTCEKCGANMSLITTSARAGVAQPGHVFFKCERCGRVVSYGLD